MTPEEFEQAYADRSGVTVEWLRQHRTVRRCQCGDESCDGWAMVSIEFQLEEEAMYPGRSFGVIVPGSVIEGRP